MECGRAGTFGTADVVRVLEDGRRPALLALTGASNVTGWLPPVEEICAEAHARGVPVLLDAAQLAPHRPLPEGPDFVAFSGHKLYAPFGAGALIGPRRVFEHGDPFLAGGGAVDLVDLDEVIWTDPPEREEAGSPNVVGAVAFGTAMDELERIGWEAIRSHESMLAARLYEGLRAIDGVRVLGPWSETGGDDGLAVATFTVEGMHHALVAARLSAEFGIGVRHGCFCAHPYLIRLLGVGHEGVDRARAAVQRGDRSDIPGAVRASCGLGTTDEDVDALLDALRALAAGEPAPSGLQAGRRHRRLLAGGRRGRVERGRAPGRRRLRPGLSAGCDAAAGFCSPHSWPWSPRWPRAPSRWAARRSTTWPGSRPAPR